MVSAENLEVFARGDARFRAVAGNLVVEEPVVGER